MRLGPEFRGQLPPGAAEQMAASLNSWRQAGIVSHVEVSGPGDPWPCAIAARQEGILYPLDRPPELPLAGCDRSPCCGCAYLAVLGDEAGDSARPARGSTPAE